MMEIKCLSEMTKFIKQNETEIEHKHLRYWYRGQTENYNKCTPCPGVYRDNFKCSDETKTLDKERHIFQDFSVSSASLFGNYKTPEDIYFLQQHYGLPTRLLDWTSNPLIALFFAVENKSEHYWKDEKGVDRGRDGVIYFMDAYQFNENNYIEKQKKLRGILLGSDVQFKKQLEVVTNWVGEMDNFVFPIRPNFFDVRISQQSSYFTFHGKEKQTITINENPTLQEITIPKGAKKNILDELLRLKIDDFFVFKDLEGLAKSIKRQYLFKCR